MENYNTVVQENSIASVAGNWLFALVVLFTGLVNFFWGNDPGYGMFVLLLAFLYIPPATAWFKKFSGFTIPLWLKIAVGCFIIWSAMGVAELPDKIDLMMNDFKH